MNSYNLTKDTYVSYLGSGKELSSLEVYNHSFFGIMEKRLRTELSESENKETNFYKTRYFKISKNSIPERFKIELNDSIDDLK